MAGVFYNMQEVVERLGKSEEQINELVAQGKLREFHDGNKRDGIKILFKVSDIEELAKEMEGQDDLGISADGSMVELLPDETTEGLEEAEEIIAPADGSGVVAPTDKPEIGIPTGESEVVAPTDKPEIEDDDILGDIMSDVGDTEGVAIEPDDTGGDDIILGDLTGADTAVGTTGINVLGESEGEYKLADDSKAETQVSNAEEQSSLGDLDDDLNLDSVGSGSGLLDLSLQADDTSLGAVLDDILPSAEEAAEGADIKPEESMAAEEADAIFEQTEPEEGQLEEAAAVPMMGQAMARYIEPEPTAVDNACGIALLVPLIAVIYAAIVLMAGTKNVSPWILQSIEGVIWYVTGGLVVLVLLIVGLAAAMGGPKKPKKKRENKPRKKKKK